VKEAIGWGAAFILVLTISKQVYDQWKEGKSEGVSPWLFIGQLGAAIGFAVYSWLVGNIVYIVANGLTFAASIVGLVILLRNRKRQRGEAAGD
jgi:MtN3 and saliva related transmembrane protein